MRHALRATVAILAMAGAAPAMAEENDLREFRIGMAASELPQSGYTEYACADAPQRKLRGWGDYADCPTRPGGTHAVRFAYDESANPLAKVNGVYEGTKVGGHPVLLTLLLGDDAHLDGLVVETDPAARLYLRKKAFLFREQVRARYGDEGWACNEPGPHDDETPVGGVFIDEHCEKTTPTRKLVLDSALFRRANQDIRDFVSRARLEVLKR